MKTMGTLILCIIFLLNGNLGTDEITAVYDGASEGVYYFTTDDMNSYGFDEMEEKAFAKYNLNDEQYVGETFDISFRIETRKDEDEMDYEAYIITDLSLVK
jgi:hypothetical protein